MNAPSKPAVPLGYLDALAARVLTGELRPGEPTAAQVAELARGVFSRGTTIAELRDRLQSLTLDLEAARAPRAPAAPPPHLIGLPALEADDLTATVARIKTLLHRAIEVCGSDSSTLITGLLGAIVTLCACSDTRDDLFQIAQDSLAQARALCLDPRHRVAQVSS